MRIEVHAHGSLRLLVPDADGIRSIDVAAPTSVAELLVRFGAYDMAWLVAINGEAVSRHAALSDGDRVDLYPNLEGG